MNLNYLLNGELRLSILSRFKNKASNRGVDSLFIFF